MFVVLCDVMVVPVLVVRCCVVCECGWCGCVVRFFGLFVVLGCVPGVVVCVCGVVYWMWV